MSPAGSVRADGGRSPRPCCFNLAVDGVKRIATARSALRPENKPTSWLAPWASLPMPSFRSRPASTVCGRAGHARTRPRGRRRRRRRDGSGSGDGDAAGVFRTAGRARDETTVALAGRSEEGGLLAGDRQSDASGCRRLRSASQRVGRRVGLSRFFSIFLSDSRSPCVSAHKGACAARRPSANCPRPSALRGRNSGRRSSRRDAGPARPPAGIKPQGKEESPGETWPLIVRTAP